MSDGCSQRDANVHMQVIVAARELPTSLLTTNETLCDEVVNRLNSMSDLCHASIIQMFGVVSPSAAPTLVSVIP